MDPGFFSFVSLEDFNLLDGAPVRGLTLATHWESEMVQACSMKVLRSSLLHHSNSIAFYGLKFHSR